MSRAWVQTQQYLAHRMLGNGPLTLAANITLTVNGNFDNHMSTLHVENLKGLSSGGNANKIIVPSGQTLDASAATITPSANQTVKTSVSRSQSTLAATTSTSYVDVMTSTITPSFNNSILLISGEVSGVSYEDSSNSYRGSTWEIFNNSSKYSCRRFY